MSRWRQAFNRIGGPDAVTWPAFWITFAANIIGHLTTGGTVNASIPVRVLIVTISQLAMFTPLLLLRFTLLRNPPRPRPWIALTGFIFAAVVRGLVVTSLLLAIGAVDQPLWAYRIIASLQSQAILLFIVAIVVSTIRAHTRSLEELIGIQRELAETQDHIVGEFTQRNEETIERVKDRLRTEVAALDSVEGANSVAELQRLAGDVVRPMSHELAQSLPAREIHTTDPVDVHVTRQQVAEQLVDRPPFRPLQAALLMTLFLVTASVAVLGDSGILVALMIFVSIFIWSQLANWGLALILPKLSPRTALVIVLIAAVAIGYLSTAAGTLLLEDSTLKVVFFVTGGVFTAGIVLLLAIVSAILRQQQESERTLVEYTERLRHEVVRLRQAQWLQNKALSRALHGPVQSTVTSAALRLDAAVRNGESTGTLVEEIRTELRSVIDVIDAAEIVAPSLDIALTRITGMWEGLCDVQTSVSPDAANILSNDPLAAATVVDILTEAVSNAVRHGKAEHVMIAVNTDIKGSVTITVSNDGKADDNTSPTTGLGTTLLDECTLHWSRTQINNAHVLSADVPTAYS